MESQKILDNVVIRLDALAKNAGLGLPGVMLISEIYRDICQLRQQLPKEGSEDGTDQDQKG